MYLAIVKMAFRNCIKGINYLDPVQMRRVHGDLMNEESCEAQCISNRYYVWINPLYFEWDNVYTHTEKQFSDALNKMLNCNCQ